MARSDLRTRGRIGAGGERLLQPNGDIDSSMAENLDMGPGPIQIFRQLRALDLATRLHNPLVADADLPARIRECKRTTS